MTLRAEGLLEDNKILTPDSRRLLEGYVQWAQERQERQDKKRAKKARKEEQKAQRGSSTRDIDDSEEPDQSDDGATAVGENKSADGS